MASDWSFCTHRGSEAFRLVFQGFLVNRKTEGSPRELLAAAHTCPGLTSPALVVRVVCYACKSSEHTVY